MKVRKERFHLSSHRFTQKWMNALRSAKADWRLRRPAMRMEQPTMELSIIVTTRAVTVPKATTRPCGVVAGMAASTRTTMVNPATRADSSETVRSWEHFTADMVGRRRESE